jgi:uncharacterized protein YlxW (UPF0749 family)
VRTRVAVFFAISIVLGFSLIVQAKSTDGMNLFVSGKTIRDLEVSIESEKAGIEDIHKRTREAEQKLEEYRRLVEDEDMALQDSLTAEWKLYRALTAATMVHGPGVIVTLDDSADEIPDWADPNQLLIHDADILRVISDLGKGGAEAISINGHRIGSGSTIYCNGYTVRINGEPEARPFIIKAIGDPANLSAVMIGPNSYGAMLREYYGIVFKVQVEIDMEIAAQSSPPIFRYARKVTESGAQTNAR